MTQLSDRKQAILDYMQRHHDETWAALEAISASDGLVEVYRDGGQLWTVRDVVAHLADSGTGLLGQARRLAAGERPVPPEFDLNRWNRGAVRRSAGVGLDELRSSIGASYAEAVDFLYQVDESTLDNEGRRGSGELTTVEGYFRRLLDHRMEHLADIQAALGR
jgi:hypothetical protein